MWGAGAVKSDRGRGVYASPLLIVEKEGGEGRESRCGIGT